MSRRAVGNTISTILALGAGAATFYVSIRYLMAPETVVDWVVQGCAGLTVGIIVFFLAWGHFQEVPEGR